MADETTDQLRFIAIELYVLAAFDAARSLLGKEFLQASPQEQQAAYQALNNMIESNGGMPAYLLGRIDAVLRKPTAGPIGLAPAPGSPLPSAPIAPASDPGTSEKP